MKKIMSRIAIIIAVFGIFASCEDPTTSNSNYTVKFEANGGNPAPNSQNIANGGKVVMPPVMNKIGYGFGGWYKEATYTKLWDFDNDKVTGNITLYAKWLENFTVTFEANGGTPQPELQIVADGGKVVEPSAISKTDFSFDGWYKEAAYTNLWDFNTDKVTGNITLYAKWGPPVLVDGTSLAAKLAWLNTNAKSGSTYLLEVTSFYEELPLQLLSYFGKSNITVQLKGIGNAKNVVFSGSGSLFLITGGVTLVLDENLILSSTNTGTLVNVGGKLIMKQGSKIDNTGGLGVFVNGDGTFTMNSGEISGNGIGVMVSGGTITMNSGEISGNGRGVEVGGGGTFTMNSGEISGSTDGVVVNGGGTFTMNSGEISGNGTGVFVNDGTFTMTGGEISGNTSETSGGGVFVNGNNSFFEKTGGIIYGYTAGDSKSNVVKDSLGVVQNKGHAVYVFHNNSSYIKRKETTTGVGYNLSYIGRLTPPIWSGNWDY
jgi:uncharacterized repeat protein (TIGR02543 family)